MTDVGLSNERLDSGREQEVIISGFRQMERVAGKLMVNSTLLRKAFERIRGASGTELRLQPN